MKKFIFDVDGTLTPSRQKISPDFISLFHDFVRKEKVYLVTGSDRAKTLEQVTPEIYNSCQRVYNCSGSDAYDKDVNVYRDDWELPKKVERFLEDELAYKGVNNPGSVAKTDMGIVWANRHGCFFYNGENVRNLLEKKGLKIISDSDWDSFLPSDKDPMVGYIPNKRQVIVADAVDDGGDGSICLFDFLV